MPALLYLGLANAACAAALAVAAVAVGRADASRLGAGGRGHGGGGRDAHRRLLARRFGAVVRAGGDAVGPVPAPVAPRPAGAGTRPDVGRAPGPPVRAAPLSRR